MCSYVLEMLSVKHPDNLQMTSRTLDRGHWHICNCSACKKVREPESKERPLANRQKPAQNKIDKVSQENDGSDVTD